MQLLSLTLAVGAGIGGIAEIGEHALGDLLILVVLGGIDLIALVEQGILGGIVVIAELVHQRLDHILDQRVGEVGVAGRVLGHHRLGLLLQQCRGIHHLVAVVVAGVAPAVGKDDLLRLGGVILRLGDLALLQHGVQDQDLALAVLLPAPLALKGAELTGIVGNADQTGTLGQRQLAGALAEVGTGRCLYAVARLSQADAVQIGFQDLILAVALFQLQRTVDLRHLTLDGTLVVAGHVLDELLGDGGAALHAPTRQGTEDGAHCTSEVHAVVLFKALVLDGDGGVLHIIGDILQIDPDAVLALAVQGLVHDPLVGLGVLIVQLGRHLGLQLVQIDLRLALQGRVDPCQEYSGKNNGGQHYHQHDGADDLPCPALLFGARRVLLLLTRFLRSLTGALLWPAKQAAALLIFAHNRAPPFPCCIGCIGRWRGAPSPVYILAHYYAILVLYHICQMLKTPCFGKFLSKSTRIVSISPVSSRFFSLWREKSHTGASCIPAKDRVQ